MSFPVPLLLIAFNRPEPTDRVLTVLRQLRPSRLFVACDGPRPERPCEADLCAGVRDLIETSIDWPCQLHKLYQPSNLGCRRGVTAALDWFFDQVEEGIVLEDDILPDLSFFTFCQELLERYRHDTRIGVIAANNHQRSAPADGSSYRFSIYSHCWGWASWRRAWHCNDPQLAGWPAFRDSGRLQLLGSAAFQQHWGTSLDQVSAGRIDSWAMVWQFSCWQEGLLTVIPEVELVENIGFDSDATHTIDERSPLGARRALAFPLRHPSVIQADRQRDADTFRRLYQRSPWGELRRKLRKARRLLLGD